MAWPFLVAYCAAPQRGGPGAAAVRAAPPSPASEGMALCGTRRKVWALQHLRQLCVVQDTASESIPCPNLTQIFRGTRATEMALHVLAYNLTRVLNIVGVKPIMAAVGA